MNTIDDCTNCGRMVNWFVNVRCPSCKVSYAGTGGRKQMYHTTDS